MRATQQIQTVSDLDPSPWINDIRFTTHLTADSLMQLVGSFKNDRLKGGAIAEEIIGDAQTDISGDSRSGHDRISAGAGEDRIFGDSNARLIDQAQGGNDWICGGAGNDSIFGDALILTGTVQGGNDQIYGGSGNDAINGDANSLFANAKGGNDQIYGGQDNDTINGDAIQLNDNAQGGNDHLFGGAGDDFIFGDSTFMLDNTQGGHDSLIGGAGNDALFGDSSPARTRTGGYDSLTGVNPWSANPGLGEVDNLTGNGGRDRFVLGDARTAYYVGQGNVDHGIIQDFKFADQDVIQLHGQVSDYELKNFSLGGISGVDIFLSGSSELIGSVLGVSTATLNLNSSAFEFVG